MKESRRNFMRAGAGIAVVAGTLGTITSCKEKAVESSTSTAPKTTVGACGLSCNACPLIKEKKCTGCGPANEVSPEMVSMKNCPVLSCASMKKIAHCGTDCMKFTDCEKLIGRPYDRSFLQKIKGRLV